MGNREDLLAGAKQCLNQKGYARTTARDIAQAAGVSLAAIGYHFGSKEALLNQALFEAVGEWGEELERSLGTSDAEAPMLERFESTWERVLAKLAEDRTFWVANFEILSQTERVPEIRQFFSEALKLGHPGLAELFLGIDPTADEKRARLLGQFCHALLVGVIVQWLIDPELAPSAHDLVQAVTTVAAGGD
jgi:AcrR family transcriptional regulator